MFTNFDISSIDSCFDVDRVRYMFSVSIIVSVISIVIKKGRLSLLDSSEQERLIKKVPVVFEDE